MTAGKSVPTKVRVNPLAFCNSVHYETGIVKHAESRYTVHRPECILVCGKTEVPIRFKLNDPFGKEMEGKKIQVKGELKNDDIGDLYMKVTAWREI